MKILIAGGTGFIGRHLKKFLSRSHQVIILTRSPADSSSNHQSINWDGKHLVTDQRFDAIINLCGIGIANRRWSENYKKKLLDSRLEPTQAIVDFIRAYRGTHKPRLINASAIGYYPSSTLRQDENTHITSKSVKDLFSHQLVSQWEKRALAASEDGAIVSCLRFGVVIGTTGGFLPRLLPSYKLGLGAIVGDANAYLSWIDIDDLCRAISFILALDRPDSIYNITASSACTQREFSKTLAEFCGRPCFLKLPPFMVKKIFGQMGEELLLANQKIYPRNLVEQGFNFHYPAINASLSHHLSNQKKDKVN